MHIVVSSSYADQINRVRNGEVDMAILGPTPYVEAQRDNPDIELLAKLDFESGFDQVVLITAARSPVTNVHSLHGRSFVFGDELSFGSHFLPRWILLKHGIHLNDLHKHAFLSNHDNVLLSVLHGDFDAGGVRLDIFNKFGDRSLRIIHGPIPIAPHVVVCRKSLDQGVRTRIRSALLELKNKKILAAISPEMQGFLPVEDGRFDLVRTIMQTVQTP